MAQYPLDRAFRNADPGRYDPDSAGYLGFGDQSGSKQSTWRTYLQDAYDAGARIIVRCHADRVLVEDGRAAGVQATYDVEGRGARLIVRAPHVVVAGGALESPALLLRSGIGGPAVGQHLRLHPASAVFGVYAAEQGSWWGAPQTSICRQFANRRDGYGFCWRACSTGPVSLRRWCPGAAAGSTRSWSPSFATRHRSSASYVTAARDVSRWTATVRPCPPIRSSTRWTGPICRRHG